MHACALILGGQTDCLSIDMSACLPPICLSTDLYVYIRDAFYRPRPEGGSVQMQTPCDVHREFLLVSPAAVPSWGPLHALLPPSVPSFTDGSEAKLSISTSSSWKSQTDVKQLQKHSQAPP